MEKFAKFGEIKCLIVMVQVEKVLQSEVEITAMVSVEQSELLKADALKFVERLHHRFEERRQDLLEKRKHRNSEKHIDHYLKFNPETEWIRKSDWQVEPLPTDLLDRRVEITGPTDAKMMINALNSGASVFMADCEDSCSPTWQNIIQGQVNLYNAVRKQLEFEDSIKGKNYTLNEQLAVLMVRPRGLHLKEEHVLVNDQAISGSLFDFGMYFYHNCRALLVRNTGPYFYLPKLEHPEEAKWWDDVFSYSEEYLGIPIGTIKATVLVETFPAVFQLNEILYALRRHSAGLNCGRWDYLFSAIKTLGLKKGVLFSDRDELTMEIPMMQAYTRTVVKTCHRRKVHAMGGMAAQIPINSDPAANEKAMHKVRKDKLREVADGHDGTWVAHPGLVQLAKSIFDQHMPTANQIHLDFEEWEYSAADLQEVPKANITEGGVRKNINIGIHYLAAWLSGNGAAAIHYLMEDAATAEISRVQVWQWLHEHAVLSDGRLFNRELFDQWFELEVEHIKSEIREEWSGELKRAARLFYNLIVAETCADFLTLDAYELIV